MVIRAKKGGNYYFTEKDGIKYYNAEDRLLSEHKWKDVKSVEIKKASLFGKAKVATLYFPGEEMEVPLETTDMESHILEMTKEYVKGGK